MKDKLVSLKKRGMSLRREHGEHSFDLLLREINDLFDTYYCGFGKHRLRPAGPVGFEVSETDDEIRVKAELPGMDEKDIEISLDENVLTIRAERKDEHEEKKRKYQVSEMSYGSIQRSFPLDAPVDRDKVKAKLKRGVLMLTLPKTEQAKSERKKIPISTE